MIKILTAVYENGVLRPLELLPLKESQRVSLTISDSPPGVLDAWLDQEYMACIDQTAEEEPALEEVRRALSKIPGNLSDDIRAGRDARG